MTATGSHAERDTQLCERLEEMAPLLLSPDSPADAPRLEEHARSCARCGARLSQERRLHSLLQTWDEEAEPLPPDLARVPAAVHADLEAATAWRPRRTLAVAALGLVCGAALIAAKGLRPDLGEAGVGMVVLVLATIVAAAAWFLLGVWRFGRRSLLRAPWRSAALLAAAAALPVLAISRSWGVPDTATFVHQGVPCGGITLGFGLGLTVLWLLLAWPARRASEFTRVGAFAGGAGALLAAGTLLLECPSSEGSHLSVWHGLSMLAAFAASAGLARLVARPVIPARPAR